RDGRAGAGHRRNVHDRRARPGDGGRGRRPRRRPVLIRVYIVDDHALVRDGLRRIIEGAGMQAAGEASRASELLPRLDDLACDVMLLDIGLPGRSGVQILEEVRVRRPEIAVLVLSTYPEAQYAARMIRAGAAGYIYKGR